MSITLKIQPQEFQPVYNPIITVLDSTNKAQNKFQYVVDIAVDGSNVSRIKVASNIAGYGEVDLHKHLEPHISFDIDHSNQATFQLMNNSFKPYGVTVYEEFETGGTVTIFTGTATSFSSTTYATNMVLGFLDYRNFDATDYELASGTTGEFISSLPDTTRVKPNDRLWVNIYNKTSGKAYYLEITTANGVYRILNNSYSSTNDTNKFLIVGVAPWNIMNTTNTVSVISGVLPIIQDSIDSYSFRILDASGNPTSVSKTIEIDRNSCTRFDNYNLVYMDKFGSFLNFNFDLAHKHNKTIERKSYQRNYGSYDSTSNTWGYNTYDRGKTHLDSNIRDKYTITSNWVTELERDRIIDLTESPEVYVLTDGGYTYTYSDVYSITSFSNNGGWLQVNASSHPYSIGDYVLFSDTNPAYNGQVGYINTATTNTFTVTIPYTSGSLLGTDYTSKRTQTGQVGGELIGINIETSSFEVKQKQTSKLINYTIDFTYSFNNYVQRG